MTPYTVRPLTPTDRPLVTPLLVREWGAKEVVALSLGNDNTRALRFYQRAGFRLTALHVDAVTEARKIKPEIPVEGLDGIPIRDELELSMELP